MIYALGDLTPCIDESAYVCDSAQVIGHVVLGPNSSVWFGAVMRGDNEGLTLGAGANVQDQAVVHSDIGYPVHIGANVTIGHSAIVHGCKIGDGSLIGMGAIIQNGAVIGKGCLIGAGALVTEHKVIPDGSLVVGTPGRVVRQLDDQVIAGLLQSAQIYQNNASHFSQVLRPIQG
ncbi:MAG: gamma carbonic anhydrase family protein [Rhodobacteraceae bacterium]|nr:gamma carbonic anhydrase family protein [Paracoccaceae bacterium]